MRALIDWRAGCGKSACPVLREGWGSNAPSLPLSGGSAWRLPTAATNLEDFATFSFNRRFIIGEYSEQSGVVVALLM
jgi:hypothetical protein